MDIVGIDPREWNMDGDSPLPYLSGEQGEWKDEVFCEHLAHGTEGPGAMIRHGDWKLSYTHLDEPEFELYDLARDPGKFTNLAGGVGDDGNSRPPFRTNQGLLARP